MVGAILLPGPVRYGSVTFDIHTFLMAGLFVIMGVQAIAFAIIGRRFASRYGFIPPSGTYDRLLESLTLERVLLAALVLMGVGVAGLVWGVAEWADRGFGHLNPSTTLRPLIVATTALVCGFQLMMSGFMSSMINIPIYERRVTDPLPPDNPTA